MGKRYKSDALAAVHETALGLAEAGVMDKRTMKAFDEIYARYWKKLYLFAYSILEDREVCEDIVQDIFTYLYTKRKELSISELKPYLFQSIKFQVIKHLRNDKIAQHHVERINSISFSNHTEEMVNFRELEASLERHLNELPERCREIFKLSRQQNLTNEEIADQLGLSVQTVKNQISKALTYLRSKLDYVITVSIIFLYSPFI